MFAAGVVETVRCSGFAAHISAIGVELVDTVADKHTRELSRCEVAVTFNSQCWKPLCGFLTPPGV